MQGGPKSKQLPNYFLKYSIVSKPVNEITFRRQIKVQNKHYNIISTLWVLNILCVTYFSTSITMLDPQSSHMRNIREMKSTFPLASAPLTQL